MHINWTFCPIFFSRSKHTKKKSRRDCLRCARPSLQGLIQPKKRDCLRCARPSLQGLIQPKKKRLARRGLPSLRSAFPHGPNTAQEKKAAGSVFAPLSFLHLSSLQASLTESWCKKAANVFADFFSCSVTQEGFKPPTFRTGIWRSIQLNYWAGIN